MKKIISHLAETLNISEKNAAGMIASTVSVLKQRLLLEETILVNDTALFKVEKNTENILIYPDKLKKALIPPSLSVKFVYKKSQLFLASNNHIVRDLKTLITIQANLDESTAQLFLQSFIDVVYRELQEQKICKIEKFGTFKRIAKSKFGFDSNAISQTDRYYIVFIPEESFKNEINKAFYFFTSTVVDIKKLPKSKQPLPNEILENLGKIVDTIQIAQPKNIVFEEKNVFVHDEKDKDVIDAVLDLEQEEILFEDKLSEHQENELINKITDSENKSFNPRIKNSLEKVLDFEIPEELIKRNESEEKEESNSTISLQESEQSSINADKEIEKDSAPKEDVVLSQSESNELVKLLGYAMYDLKTENDLPEQLDVNLIQEEDIVEEVIDEIDSNSTIQEENVSLIGTDEQTEPNIVFENNSLVDDEINLDVHKKTIIEEKEDISDDVNAKKENSSDIFNHIDIEAIVDTIGGFDIVHDYPSSENDQKEEYLNIIADKTKEDLPYQQEELVIEPSQNVYNSIDIDAIMSTVKIKDNDDVHAVEQKIEENSTATVESGENIDLESDSSDTVLIKENVAFTDKKYTLSSDFIDTQNYVEKVLKKGVDADRKDIFVKNALSDKKVDKIPTSYETKGRYKLLIPDDKYSDERIKERKQRRRIVLLVLTALGVFVLLSGIFYANFSKKRPSEVIPVVVDASSGSGTSLDDEVDGILSKDEVNDPSTRFLTVEEIEPGETLETLSEKYYGNKAFWVYLYEANKEKIIDPLSLDIGSRIVIPDPKAYGFDIKSEAAIELAKKKGDIIKLPKNP